MNEFYGKEGAPRSFAPHYTVKCLLNKKKGRKGRCGGSLEMWWLIGRAPDFWGRGPGFESGIFHNDPDALQDHYVKM